MPDAHVLKLLAAQVEHKSLHRRDALYRDRLLLDEALLQRIEIVLGRPGRGPVLNPTIEFSGLEILKRRRAVAVIRELEGVEIVLAAHHRQILGPVVGHALVSDLAARIDGLDLVRAVAERRLDGRLTKVALFTAGVFAFPVMFRHDATSRRRSSATRDCL